jgi:hypothetical protein
MAAERWEYRVRIATRGADDVEGEVEFILSDRGEDDETPLMELPAITGTGARLLAGGTEIRPFTVEGLDRGGELIQALTDEGRWVAVGRLMDVQARKWGEEEWRTYGTGRCTALDELEGPGKFRLGVSDESWVARKGRAFGGVSTTQIWPAGPIYPWRGQSIVNFRHPFQPRGQIIEQQGELYRIRLTKRIEGYQSFVPIMDRGSITDALLEFIRSDQKEGFNFTTTGRTAGNFRHLRLYYGEEALGFPDPVNPWQGWEIVSFGGLNAETMFESLEEWVNVGNENAVANVVLNIWIWWPGIPFQLPAEEGLGFLWAPTAPPSPALPLLVGVDEPAHPWGTDGGWIHPVDMTRRVWDRLGLRYDPDNLDALEAQLDGMGFPAASPSVDDGSVDPERWMEDHIWGPSGLLALKDGAGRRKLVDVRWHQEDLDTEALPVLNTSNAKEHRWRLVGSEMRNRWIMHYHHYRNPFPGESPERLDFLVAEERESDPYDSNNVPWVNARPQEINARQFLSPTEPDHVHNYVFTLKRGWDWRSREPYVAQGALDIYQDGPVYYTGEIGRTLADTLEEGSYALVDESELKGANPATAARSGLVLVLIISLTRHPAYAEYEAIRIRPVVPLVFEDPCPS